MALDGVLIGGRWQAPASGESIAMLSPSDGREIGRIARGGSKDIDRAVAAARRAFEGAWGSCRRRARPADDEARPADRGAPRGAGAARSADTGKPLKQARADIAARALLRVLRRRGRQAARRDHALPRGYRRMILREPHGVTGHIIPWNYPMQIFGRSVGGALAAGNACVRQAGRGRLPAALRVAELAAEAGFPAGAINVVTGYGDEAGAALAGHPGIDHISLHRLARGRHADPAGRGASTTCPVHAGARRQVAADRVRRRGPRAALPVVVNAIVQNAGQTCSAGSRAAGASSRSTSRCCERWPSASSRCAVGPPRCDLDCRPADPRDAAAARVRASSSRRAARRHRDGGAGQRRRRARRAAATTQRRRCCATCRGRTGSRRRRCSARCWRRCRSTTRTMRSRSPTAPTSAWSPASGRATAAASCACAKRVRSGQVFVNNYGAGGGVELPFGGVKHSGYGREKGFEALYGFTVAQDRRLQPRLRPRLRFCRGSTPMTSIPQSSRAAVLRQFRDPVRIEEVPIPDRDRAGRHTGQDRDVLDLRHRRASVAGRSGPEGRPAGDPRPRNGRSGGEAGAGADRDSAGQALREGDRIVWTHTACNHCFFCTVARQPTLVKTAAPTCTRTSKGRPICSAVSRNMPTCCRNRVASAYPTVSRVPSRACAAAPSAR